MANGFIYFELSLSDGFHTLGFIFDGTLYCQSHLLVVEYWPAYCLLYRLSDLADAYTYSNALDSDRTTTKISQQNNVQQLFLYQYYFGFFDVFSELKS